MNCSPLDDKEVTQIHLDCEEEKEKHQPREAKVRICPGGGNRSASGRRHQLKGRPSRAALKTSNRCRLAIARVRLAMLEAWAVLQTGPWAGPASWPEPESRAEWSLPCAA